MVWHHTVAPGDVVVMQHHKSILHSIIMTGSIGVPEADAQPLRHYRLRPQSEFEIESIKAKIAAIR
jgi:arginine/lysine/ornithine decarboxylase